MPDQKPADPTVNELVDRVEGLRKGLVQLGAKISRFESASKQRLHEIEQQGQSANRNAKSVPPKPKAG
jgi:hypothetical protein